MNQTEIIAMAVECGGKVEKHWLIVEPGFVDYLVMTFAKSQDFATRIAEKAIAEHLAKQSAAGLPALPAGIDEEVDCGDCDGKGYIGEPLYMGNFQPPEPEQCSSCNGSGKWKITTYGPDQMREYALAAIAAQGVAK